jgi:hypothetical protein
MIRASRSIVYSAKAYVVRVIPVKRVTDATLALFDVADTLPQCGLQVDRPAVLVEEIGEGLVGRPAPGNPAAVPRQQVESVPCLLIELNALAGHRDILLGDNSGHSGSTGLANPTSTAIGYPFHRLSADRGRRGDGP